MKKLDNKIFIYLLLLIVFPIGIIFLLLSKKFHIYEKIILISIFFISLIYFINQSEDYLSKLNYAHKNYNVNTQKSIEIYKEIIQKKPILLNTDEKQNVLKKILNYDLKKQNLKSLKYYYLYYLKRLKTNNQIKDSLSKNKHILILENLKKLPIYKIDLKDFDFIFNKKEINYEKYTIEKKIESKKTNNISTKKENKIFIFYFFIFLIFIYVKFQGIKINTSISDYNKLKKLNVLFYLITIIIFFFYYKNSFDLNFEKYKFFVINYYNSIFKYIFAYSGVLFFIPLIEEFIYRYCYLHFFYYAYNSNSKVIKYYFLTLLSTMLFVPVFLTTNNIIQAIYITILFFIIFLIINLFQRKLKNKHICISLNILLFTGIHIKRILDHNNTTDIIINIFMYTFLSYALITLFFKSKKIGYSLNLHIFWNIFAMFFNFIKLNQ